MIVLDLINDPNTMTPSMIVFGLNLKYLINYLVLLLIGLLMLNQKPSMLPQLKVLNLLIQRFLVELHLVFKCYYSCQETHFLHIPTIVIGLTKWYQFLSQLICSFVENLKFDMFLQLRESLIV